MTDGVIFRSPLARLKTLLFGDVGFGEGYVSGEIEVKHDLSGLMTNKKIRRLLPYRRKHINQTAHHYNIPPEFYELILGHTMAYSCANFDSAINLEAAQRDKLRQHIQWLDLDSDSTLLNCGCGWGSLESMLREYTTAYICGITVSDEQYNYCQDSLANNTDYQCTDWRDFKPLISFGRELKFNRFVSIGMLEHVGKDNLPAFFAWIKKITTANAIGTLQFISRDKPISPWADKWIFPGAYPPNLNEVCRLMRQNGLKITDLVERGGDYVLTLKAWLNNFESNLDEIKALGFDDKFIRMFRLYLNGGIASFNGGDSQLIQLRFVK